MLLTVLCETLRLKVTFLKRNANVFITTVLLLMVATMHVVPYATGQNLRTSQQERTTEAAFSNKATLFDISTKRESQDVTTSKSAFASDTQPLDEDNLNTQNYARNYPFNTSTTKVSLRINRQTSVSVQVADDEKHFNPEEGFDITPTAKSLLPDEIGTPVITLGTDDFSKHFNRKITTTTITEIVPDNSTAVLTTLDYFRQTAVEVTAQTLTTTGSPTEITSAGTVVTMETTYSSTETDEKKTPVTFTTTTKQSARNNESYNVTLTTTKGLFENTNEDTQSTLPITNESYNVTLTTTKGLSENTNEDTQSTLPITNENYSVTLTTTKGLSENTNEDTQTTLPITNESYSVTLTTTKGLSENTNEDTQSTLPIINESYSVTLTTTKGLSENTNEDTQSTLPITNESYNVTLTTTKGLSENTNEDTQSTLSITNESYSVTLTTTKGLSENTNEDTQTILPKPNTSKQNTEDSSTTLADEHSSGQIATGFERTLKSDLLLKIPPKSISFGDSNFITKGEISNVGSLQGTASDIKEIFTSATTPVRQTLPLFEEIDRDIYSIHTNRTLLLHQTDGTAIDISNGVCDFCLYEGEGNFSSYGYPAPYRSNLECTYRIKRVDDSCELEVTFHDFDLTSYDTGTCNEDYLLVDERRFCGNSWRGKSTTINFPRQLKELTFYFHSNNIISGGGFWIEVKRKPGTCTGISARLLPSCDRTFLKENFFLRSPNYPDNYPTLTVCHYEVGRVNSDICGLEMKFLKFDIEPSDSCVYDFLKVDDKKLCGVITPEAVRVFMFQEERKTITFLSDGQATRPGFNIEVRQIKDCYPENVLPPPPSCDVCIDSVKGEINSYGYPNVYRNNLQCKYSIEEHNDTFCSVTFNVVDFDVDYTPSCIGDYLELEERRYCGNELRGHSRTVSFRDRKSITLMFQTDSVSVKRGFKINFQQHRCSGVRAPFTTVSNTQNNKDPSEVSDSFSPFERFREDPDREFEVFGSVPPPVVPESTSLRDAAEGLSEIKPTGPCVYVFAEYDFIIQSKNYPDNYENNLDCQYVIRRQGNVCRLELIFVSFEVESSRNCEYDYLEIDGEKLCGSLPADLIRNIDFKTDEKIFHFHSDGANPRPGFFIQAHERECETGTERPLLPRRRTCDQDFSDRVFELTSVNYPGDYENLLSCHYNIKKYSDDVCSLELTFLDFSVQNGPDCLHDSLQVNNELICGDVRRGTVRTFEFRGRRTLIHFYSDALVTSRGFHIRVTQKECIPTATSPPFVGPTFCNERFTALEFEITSVNYPNNYNDKLNCRYTVVKYNGLVCRLELTFVDFNIQQSPDCSDDYLEVNGDRLCGKLRENTRQTIEFFEAAKVLSFHSNDRRNDKGYKIHVLQRECETFTTRTPFLPDNSFCSDVYTRKEFYLSSVNYPQNYDNNLDCSYVIRRYNSNVCSLRLQFLDFDVESSTDCEYDYLDVDGQKLCGTLPAGTSRTYDFQSFEKVIHFRTDSASSRPGFRMRITQEECSQTSAPTLTTPLSRDCHENFRELEFDITSEEYPREYPNNRDCRYAIYRQNNICQLELTFLTFDVEGNEDCRYDYLRVDGETLCGALPVGESRILDFKTSKKVIEFHSDSATTRQGFHIRARQIPCST
ncbi:cubilin-like isoform X1 [Tachypleus tridentatus]|uniref:cubilin-like isoform X1 n=1 Tax=Tachypleus tridentatus TaxID=6853 RepID=UPI003FD2912B